MRGSRGGIGGPLPGKSQISIGFYGNKHLDRPHLDKVGPPPPPLENVRPPLEPWKIIVFLKKHHRTPSWLNGSVVECLTRDIGATGSSLTGITLFWSLSKTHLSWLSTGQPRKTRPYITERLLMGRKESNKENRTPL